MPRRGGGWLREAVFSHAAMPTPPRFARLPLPEEGARMILNRTSPHMYSRRCRCRTPEPEASDFTRRLLSRLCRLCIYVRVLCTYRDRCIRGDAATSALSPSYQSKESAFLPPSVGRRCPEGAEVGSRSGIFTYGDANPASLRSSAPSRGRGENDS